jgi:hypothetical protein
VTPVDDGQLAKLQTELAEMGRKYTSLEQKYARLEAKVFVTPRKYEQDDGQEATLIHTPLSHKSDREDEAPRTPSSKSIDTCWATAATPAFGGNSPPSPLSPVLPENEEEQAGSPPTFSKENQSPVLPLRYPDAPDKSSQTTYLPPNQSPWDQQFTPKVEPQGSRLTLQTQSRQPVSPLAQTQHTWNKVEAQAQQVLQAKARPEVRRALASAPELLGVRTELRAQHADLRSHGRQGVVPSPAVRFIVHPFQLGATRQR